MGDINIIKIMKNIVEAIKKMYKYGQTALNDLQNGDKSNINKSL